MLIKDISSFKGMCMAVKVSVIMPVYNGTQFVAKAIESILGQSLRELELIVIDDCSLDDTFCIVNGFKDSRLRVYKNAYNMGNYKSRNIGNELARGKYIAVMDADDVSIADRLLIQYDYLEQHPEIGLVGSFAEYIDERGTIMGVLQKPIAYNDIKLALLLDNCFIHSSMMYRKRLVKRYHILYDENLRYSADYRFAVQCSRKFKICNIDQILIYYRKHADQISEQKKDQQIRYANEVRINQLNRFRLNPSRADLASHLELMQFRSHMEIHQRINWFNRILAANLKLKVYNHLRLYDFLRIVSLTQ